MALHQDVLMRMLQRMVQAFARAIAAGAASPEEAVRTIDDAIGDALRGRIGLQHMEFTEHLDAHDRSVAAHVGRLFALRAQVSEEEEERLRDTQAAILYLRNASPRPYPDTSRTPLDELADVLGTEPVRFLFTRGELAALYRELAGRAADPHTNALALAEDFLFHALELSDDEAQAELRAWGLALFERQLHRLDVELDAGGLSRAEIETICRELS